VGAFAFLAQECKGRFVVMFQGAAALSLDAKGRIAVPARHREPLVSASEGRLVLTAHPHRCLLLYPETAWEPIRDKVLAASSLNPRSALIKRLLVGQGSHFEIWSDAGWQQQQEAVFALGDQLLPADLEDLAL